MKALVSCDRNAPWLENAALNGDTIPIKYVASINPESLAESTDEDHELLYIDIGNVDSNGNITALQAMKFGSAPSRARRVVRQGDVVVSTVRTYLRAIAAVEEDDPRLIASTGFAVVRPNPRRVHPGFMRHWLRSDPVVDEVCARSVGISYPATNASEVGSIPVVLPPLPTQRRIADFLDLKTAAVDALIEKKERLLALLAEKRAALIHRAVTKGLDPSVPMKDSGVPWIGEVPEHWGVKRLKFACQLESGHTPSRSEPRYWVPEECVLPWVSLNDTKTLKASDHIDDTFYKISPLGMANSSAHLIDAGAVVFTRDATIGLAAITTRPMAVSQHIIAWLPGPEVEGRFLLRVINAMTQELDRLTFGATIKTIGMGDIKELVMPCPPIAEQDAIVRSLSRRLAVNEEVVGKVDQQLYRLREYRQALITAAVAGQLDLDAADTDLPLAAEPDAKGYGVSS